MVAAAECAIGSENPELGRTETDTVEKLSHSADVVSLFEIKLVVSFLVDALVETRVNSVRRCEEDTEAEKGRVNVVAATVIGFSDTEVGTTKEINCYHCDGRKRVTMVEVGVQASAGSDCVVTTMESYTDEDNGRSVSKEKCSFMNVEESPGLKKVYEDCSVAKNGMKKTIEFRG
ncbi:hypothetical protein EAI_04825 [Harpegnathos saltator]|uniref:Uncharacterized protein n=1 Tax=Harpegnathos saltator TaxID=610380 RepID=E2C8R6_HARSA|nr:hypothetical protein EAI_04825 [Harpegnathos saltator]